jgi:hypothetical protein
MNGNGKLRVHKEAGARLSGVMGKGKGEAWAPAAIFISHIVLLSRSDATYASTARLPCARDPAYLLNACAISPLRTTAVNSPQLPRSGP